MRQVSRLPGFLTAVACLLCAAASFAVPPAKVQPRTNKNVPPSQLCRLPDLVVVSLTIDLVSTTVGQPGVEFPADKLKITAVVKDNGGVKSPGKFRVRLLRGLTTQLASKSIPAPTAHGQVWSLVHTMTYTHGVPPAFFVKVDADFAECDKANNTLSIGLNDEVLHRDGTQQAAASGIGTVQVPGSVVILF